MGTIIQELLNAAHSGSSELNRWLDEHTSELTLELAMKVREIFKQVINSGKGPLAAAAVLGAAFIFLRLGKKYEALTNYFDYYQILFMNADNVEAYQRVREGSHQILSMAEEIEANDLVSKAATLAADSSYFASKCEDDPMKKKPWLMIALEEIANASTKAKYFTSPVSFENFVSLLSAIVSEVISWFWSDKEKAKVQKMLHKLAAETEVLIPIDFEFSGDTLKTNSAARELSSLSYCYGTPAVANARLAFATKRAEEASDIEIWMQTVFDHYVGARNSGIPHLQLIRLRKSLRRQVEQYRIHFRSRVGRLWVAQELDHVFGEILRDELREESAVSELFESVETTKARALLDQMGVGIHDFSNEELAVQALEMERKMLRFEPDDTNLVFSWDNIPGNDTNKLLTFLKNDLDINWAENGKITKTDDNKIIYVSCEQNSIEITLGKYKENAILKTNNGKICKLQVKEKNGKFNVYRMQLIYSEIKLASLLSIGTSWDRTERSKMLKTIEDFYANHQSGFHEQETVSSLSQVMSALQPGEALIEYCIPYNPLHPALELWILAITTQKAQVIPVFRDRTETAIAGRMDIDGRQPVDASPLGNLIVETRIAIQEANEEKSRAGLKTLYQLLVSPLLEAGLRPQDFHRWITVPHGMLHSIPFAALMDAEGRHLIEDVALTVTPSASVWCKLQGRKPQPVTSFLGFVNPDLSSYSDLDPLENAEKELDRIKKYLKDIHCTICKRKEATEVTLRAQIVNKNIIHLATHGEFPEEDAIDFHRILLTPAAEHDGRVHAEELRRMDLHSARLVVLSICNGGLYRFGPGDEPYGLIPALLIAGAENILGTLWPIADEYGRLFMIEFYKHLLHLGPAEAIRRTCKTFIQDQAQLCHWAGFTLIGSGRPLN